MRVLPGIMDGSMRPVIVRIPDAGLRVALAVKDTCEGVTVRLWIGRTSMGARWSPRSRVVGAAQVVGEATRREQNVGMPVDHWAAVV